MNSFAATSSSDYRDPSRPALQLLGFGSLFWDIVALAHWAYSQLGSIRHQSILQHQTRDLTTAEFDLRVTKIRQRKASGLASQVDNHFPMAKPVNCAIFFLVVYLRAHVWLQSY